MLELNTEINTGYTASSVNIYLRKCSL